MKATRLKVIVIDNDHHYHESYRYFFSTYNDFPLSGLFRTVEEALQHFDVIEPDIVVTDVTLPGTSGIEGIADFRIRYPEIKVIMVSAENDYEVIKKAFKNGANGYLTKPLTRKRLKHALNSIKYEGAVLSNDIAAKVIAMFQRKSYDVFSKRENQIIEYLSQGATYKFIADKLYVTTSTINFHIQNIYLKLDVNSKSEALQKLRELDFS